MESCAQLEKVEFQEVPKRLVSQAQSICPICIYRTDQYVSISSF